MRDPKQFRDQFSLDYFRRPRPLRRGRLALSIGAAVVCAIAVGVVWAIPGGHVAFQSRPVTSPHAPFADNCTACHVGGFQTVSRFLPTSHHPTSTPDGKCLACHTAPSHHANQTRHHDAATGLSTECSYCHREHRGTPLVELPDSFCTACHADLQTADGNHTFAKSIRSFGSDHPPFGAHRGGLPTDPAADQFRFNHRKHMVELLEGYARDVPPGRQGDIREPLRQLAEQGCQFCHRSDTTEREMQPVRYDAHCRACHPLTPVGVEGSVPHPAAGQSSQLVRAFVRERLTKPVPPPTDSDAPAWLRREPIAEANPTELADVERQLFDGRAGCGLCHVEKGRDNGVPIYTVPRLDAGNGLRGRWMPGAKFDHGSHAMIRCEECHAARDSRLTGDVLMPAIDGCRRCHHDGPSAARSDCLTCHEYHGHNRGSTVPPKTIDEWLQWLGRSRPGG